MLYWGGTNVDCGNDLPWETNRMLIHMVKDLEDTREKFFGYSYVRTMRNILIGKEDAAIAPFFSEKPYYGIFSYLTLKEVEDIMDALVRSQHLEIIYTDHGKLYCTPEYYSYNC